MYWDPILNGKQESRNKIEDFKEENIKNQERMMTIYPYKNIFLLYMSKERLHFTLNTVYFEKIIWNLTLLTSICLKMSRFSNELLETRQYQDFINKDLEKGKTQDILY